MKNLDKKIIRNVYVIETRKTFVSIVIRVIGIIFICTCIILVGSVIFDIFVEQQTFDLLRIFEEDGEIISNYWADVMRLIVEETPKELVMVLGIGIILLFFSLFNIKKNFYMFINKLRSIIKYWRNK